MPAFITNGPEIPERLLQAHEEGRVVFFCGAGISYPAKLPGFSGLVKKLYSELGVSPNPIQQAAIKAFRFDTAIGLLESGIVGGRETVRRKLATVLTPDLSTTRATATHEALLTLARNRSGQLRLVTTNFDRLFEEVIASKSHTVEAFKAPLLPVPKNRWDGLVYLHGLLPSSLTVSELDRLVVSSGDFGLAYLIERWAARFVSELFRNYTVCFVGYSINDPVLRYMMDALAADRLLGESPPEMFAFGSYSKGKEKERFEEWGAKNVTPILYHEFRRHYYLNRTLRAWAETYRDGVRGKQMIIAQHATTPPLTSSRSDFSVGRVLWALTDGLAAKHFADLNPVPPLKWLEPLADEKFGHEDLPRFGVIPNSEKDDRLSFSFTLRPTPYTNSPRMSIVDIGARDSNWDDVMLHLARWLTRHLNNASLVLWLAKQGGQLHEKFARLIRSRIKDLYRMEKKDKKEEIKRLLESAPMAIPSPLMHILWRLILSGRVRSHAHSSGLHDWLYRFKQDGITPDLRIELRELLTPRVMLREPFRLPDELTDPDKVERIKDLVNWELVLTSDHVHSIFRNMKNDPVWQESLADLLLDFTILLRDALDLMRELSGEDDKSDFSYIVQPSISEHEQNRKFHDWTALIDLTRDAWLAMEKIDPTQARLVAESWWQIPYPLFKRLAFFAAANSDAITPREALDWLLADDQQWFWLLETEREAIRLMVDLAPKLDELALAEIEQAILHGPPNEMFTDDIEPERKMHIVDREVWLLLAKVEATGAVLSQHAKSRLDELRQRYPNWKIAQDERDEFPHWMDEGEGWRKFVSTPSRLHDLKEWLKQPSTDFWQEDDWHQRCREDFPTTAAALRGLAQEGQWPVDRWREALQAWAEDKLLKPSWRDMAQVIGSAPRGIFQALSHSVSWWLKAQAKVFERHEELFFGLIRRLLSLEYENGDQADEPVSRAINHPVGHATESLLRLWYRQEVQDAQGLTGEVRSLFTQICDTEVKKFRHGRVLMAAHVIALFRVDEQWAKTYLLPLFGWQKSQTEARAAWQGFLWSPRLYRPLILAFKQPLLETARHYDQLNTYAEQYVAFLTFAALDPGDTFTTKELAEATCKLPSEGLQFAAQTVTRALEGAGEQRSEYWRNRVLPYLKSVWPKSRDVRTPSISEGLGQLSVASREKFPEAMKVLKHWLIPVEYPDYIINLLCKAKLCKQFPTDSLTFLNAVISNEAQWLPSELEQCLDDIANEEQTLTNDPRFVRLTDLCERVGTA